MNPTTDKLKKLLKNWRQNAANFGMLGVVVALSPEPFFWFSFPCMEPFGLFSNFFSSRFPWLP